MSQTASQEVPSTPQIGILMTQKEECFNQRVPSQDINLHSDEPYLVPRTPTGTGRQKSTPVSTTLYGGNQSHSLLNHFRTPRRTYASAESPAAQVVPATPNFEQVTTKLNSKTSELIESPLYKGPRCFSDSTNSTVVDSTFRLPGLSATPNLGRRNCKTDSKKSVRSMRTDLRKQLLSTSRDNLTSVSEHGLRNDNKNGDDLPKSHGRNRSDGKDDGTFRLLQDVANRLQSGKTVKTGVNQNRRKTHGGNCKEASGTCHRNDDFLDIIDDTEAA